MTHLRASRAHHRTTPLKVNRLVKAIKLADLHSGLIEALETSQMGVSQGRAGIKQMEAALQLINGIVVKAALREGLLEDIHLEINSRTALRSSRIDVVVSLISRTLFIHHRLPSLKTTRIMTSYARKYLTMPCSSTDLHLFVPSHLRCIVVSGAFMPPAVSCRLRDDVQKGFA